MEQKVTKANSRNRLSRTRFTVPRAQIETTETTPDVQKTSSDDRDVLRTYMQDIAKTPLLTEKEEVELAARIKKGDDEARNHMISANLRLVVKIAHGYKNFGLPLIDLVSEGNLGLIKAVERFDPSKGGKLSTYAAYWIKQSIKRALANQSKTIRLPVHLVDKIANIRHTTTQLRNELNREPYDEEIGCEIGLSANKVSHLKSVSSALASLDAPISEEGDTSLGELVGDENQINPLENLQQKSIHNDIQTIINSLEFRERDIIRLRFGLNQNYPLTLEEIGNKFGITRERVRQIQRTAIHKMRAIMTENERQRNKNEVHQEHLKKARMEVFQEFFQKSATCH